MSRKSKRIGPYSSLIIAAARAVLAQHPDGLTLVEIIQDIKRTTDLYPNAYEVRNALDRSCHFERDGRKYRLKRKKDNQ